MLCFSDDCLAASVVFPFSGFPQSAIRTPAPLPNPNSEILNPQSNPHSEIRIPQSEADPACDISGFLCFQTAFVGGCP